MDATKQAGAVVLAEPDGSSRKSKMCAWLLQNIAAASAEDGLDQLIAAIAAEEPGDEFRLYEAWLALEKCNRHEKEKMSSFIDRMNECIRRLEENSLTLPGQLKALLFIMRCRVEGYALRALLIEAGSPPNVDKVTTSLRQQFSLEQLTPKPFRPGAALAQGFGAGDSDAEVSDDLELGPDEEERFEAFLARRTIKLKKSDPEAAAAAKRKGKQLQAARKKRNEDRLKNMQCWNCKGYGHLANSPQCPMYKKPTAGLAEGGDVVPDQDPEAAVAQLSLSDEIDPELGAYVAELQSTDITGVDIPGLGWIPTGENETVVCPPLLDSLGSSEVFEHRIISPEAVASTMSPTSADQ